MRRVATVLQLAGLGGAGVGLYQLNEWLFVTVASVAVVVLGVVLEPGRSS